MKCNARATRFTTLRSALLGRFGIMRLSGLLLLLTGITSHPIQAATFSADSVGFVQTYCSDCHGRDQAEAHLSLVQMLEAPEFATSFRAWEKIASVIEQKKMPPVTADQPTDEQRVAFAKEIRRLLHGVVDSASGDPGPITLRRLTGAEYEYTIHDLTGLSLDLQRTLAGDAVGGEGFANVGDVQFFQESTLEQYLEAAKHVARHAVVGAGPLQFSEDPGATGQELSAIRRIKRLYRQHGFRTAAGEGAEPYGLDLYPRSFFVAWKFLHRTDFQCDDTSLSQLADAEDVPPAFATHIWNTLQQESATFPTRELIEAWRVLPAPSPAQSHDETVRIVRAACQQLGDLLRGWQRRLARRAGDGEEASILTADSVDLMPTANFRLNLKFPEGMTKAQWKLQTAPAMPDSIETAIVLWKQPTIRFRKTDGTRLDAVDLFPLLTPESRVALTESIRSLPVDANTNNVFWMARGQNSVTLELLLPEDVAGAVLQMEAAVVEDASGPPIVRCTVSADSLGTTAADAGETSAILGVAKGPTFETWKTGVQEFARQLPAVSHREPTPSDRDPIPAPYDNAYNGAERNEFHYKIKYHREDGFLTKYLLSDEEREELDEAWADLLLSFDYHDTFLAFVLRKHHVPLPAVRISTLDEHAMASLPTDALPFVQALKQDYEQARQRMLHAEPRHQHDLAVWATRAWRRPLTEVERRSLQEFYRVMRQEHSLSHAEAVRSTLARILVAPAFLFRLEPSTPNSSDHQFLSPYELASRLSYFLWSSIPDDQLLQHAASGRILEDDVLREETRRMLADPRSRRLAGEFFGQWFGFYRFDEFQGIDANRFPELDRQLKQAMYEEARTFFGHIVQNDRSVDEILFADYAFWNDRLRKHYLGDEWVSDQTSGESLQLVASVHDAHRGGLLGLAAIHAVTSAPLRTSPVKRGDWILRRVLGTPVPPPPADAGSLPADDVLADGASVRDRLVAHRQNATCVNCHARIDPLGFALENYDPIGRWRTTYRDGKPIEDSGTLEDGTIVDGPDGLHQYLQSRQPDFHRTLSVKLLGYAMGRSERLTDQPLVDTMVRKLQEDDRFSTLVHEVVQSSQFRRRARFQD